MPEVISHDTTGADPVTNAEQAARWTEQANKLAAADYLVRWKNWLLRKTETNAAPEPEPQAPFVIHWAWVEHQGEVMTVGPDRVAAPPVPSPRITEVGKLDDVIGGVKPNYSDGRRYDLSNKQYGEGWKTPDGRTWILDAEGFGGINHFWREFKIGAA